MTKRMTSERARTIIARLDSFNKLERKATDETGWIAFAYSVDDATARKMIEQARRIVAKEDAR